MIDEDIQQKMYRVNKSRKADVEYNKTIYREKSRKRLSTILEKKMKTSFIGALSQFEQYFGRLWGHGKQEEELTDNELKFRKVWEDTRTAILNNGNNQLRAVQNEISEYSISWNRHKLNIPIGGNSHEKSDEREGNY